MSIYILQNEELTVHIDEFGAELTSIIDNRTKIEYLWNADPAFWKRHSPILFPVVGSLKNQSYNYNGKTYSLSQHGFARDMTHLLLDQTDTEIWFRLEATDETKKVYPFDFILEIGYQLLGRKINVLWKVINPSSSDLHFSIGGHPAFMCPLDKNSTQSDYFIAFDSDEPIHYLLIDEHGLAVKNPLSEQDTLSTNKNLLSINPHLFDHDALIIEDNQYHRVSLVDSEKKPYLSVSFDAPLFGLWSPVKKNAPFVCIEPWYGRCDSSDFKGTLEEREWSNMLEGGEQFEASYTIDIV
jgi:galactose mutarotase-like enzyme